MIDRVTRFFNAVSFHRGLALGAMVGAAIAGSTLWGRFQGVRARRVPDQDTGRGRARS